MISKEIIDILNKDEKARDLMAKFERALEKEGKDLTDKAIDEATNIIYMLAIGQNKEAMDLLGGHMWEELRKE